MATVTREREERAADRPLLTLNGVLQILREHENGSNFDRVLAMVNYAMAQRDAALASAPPADEDAPFRAACDRIRAVMGWKRDPREIDDLVLEALHQTIPLETFVSAPPAAPPEDARWRCFHCDEVFDNDSAAAEHFGSRETFQPACRIDIAAYRRLEAAYAKLQADVLEECTPIENAMRALQSEHAVALRRAEEDGYARGLAASAAPPDPPELKAEKDGAYRQRNVLVATLARLFPSGVRQTDIPGWSSDWHGCCFIDLPTGQISYHFHDSQAYLFDGLPAYDKPWDGHDKATVEARLSALAARQSDPPGLVALMKETHDIVDGYDDQLPSVKVKQGTSFAVAVGMLKRWLAAYDLSAPASPAPRPTKGDES